MDKFKEGDSVTYFPEYSPDKEGEKGVVKSVQDENFVFVVYNCGGEWHKYKEYTAARTNVKDLKNGWYN